jgi:hypothetical protein
MARRQQDRLRNRHLDDAAECATPRRGTANQRDPQRIAAPDCLDARLGFADAHLAGHDDAVGVRCIDLQTAAQGNPYGSGKAVDTQYATASTAQNRDQTVARRRSLQRQLEVGAMLEMVHFVGHVEHFAGE